MTDAQAKRIGIRAVRQQPEAVRTAFFAELNIGISKIPLASLPSSEIPERMTEMGRQAVERLRSLGFKISWNSQTNTGLNGSNHESQESSSQGPH